MILIKKYANRRLYDTSNSSYITLPECADILRTSQQVQIIDAKTNQDITVLVMIQIIMECEQQRQILPVNALRQIIKAYDSQSASLLASHLERAMSSFAHQHLTNKPVQTVQKAHNQADTDQPIDSNAIGAEKRALLEQLREEMMQLSRRIDQL